MALTRSVSPTLSDTPVSGYPRLAELFAEFPEVSCFRTFDSLSYESLLYQQAALCRMELEVEVWNKKSVGAAESWQTMDSADRDSIAGRKREKFAVIQQQLRHYKTDLLLVTEMQKLVKPSRLSFDFLGSWLLHPEGGNKFLKANELKPWGFEGARDLVAIAKQPDRLDCVLMGLLSPTWHRIAKPWRKPFIDVEHGIGKLWYYEPRHFVLLADICCILACTGVPAASIALSCWAKSTKVRLVIISLSTLILATTVLMLFGCRRAETFGAALAFCAVEVVFVQSVVGLKL